MAPPTAPRSVVVFVPGTTGSVLAHADGGIVWGLGRNLIFPRDRGYSAARSVVSPEEDDVTAIAILEELRLLGVVRKPVYGPLLELVESLGYRRGDLDAPRSGDALFPFPYDWRLPSPVNAARLAVALEELRRRRGGGLEVTLICQSAGVHVCRYLQRYGSGTLDEAASGTAGPPPGVDFAKVIFVGPSTGGSLRILELVTRGRRYIRGIGRFMAPEVLFSFPGLFDDLPSYRGDLFVDRQGRPVTVDLYATESWRTYGWGVFAPDVAARLATLPGGGRWGDVETRERYLAAGLRDSGRLHEVLAEPPPEGDTEYFLITSVYRKTSARAVLWRDGDGWRTLLSGDPRLAGEPFLDALISASGDGHATTASQLALTRAELDALGDEPFAVDGPHFAMILAPETARRLADWIGSAR